MVVRKTHLIAVGFLVVLALAYFAQRTENQRQLSRDREANVALCMAGVERAAIIATGFQRLSERVGSRDNPGDQLSSKDYFAVGQSVIRTFPGVAAKDGSVERIEGPDGSVRFQVSAESKKIEEAGCRQAFK